MTAVMTVLALLLIAGCAWQGWRAGLLRRVLELAGAVASFYFATAEAAGLGALLTGWTRFEGRARLYVGWIVLFLLGLLLTRLVAALAAKALQFGIVGWVDRLGGAVCGLLIGLLLASALLHLAGRMPGGEARRAGFAANPVTRAILVAAPALSGSFRDLGGAPERAWHGLRDGARRAAGAAAEAVDERLRPDVADSLAAPPAARPGG